MFRSSSFRRSTQRGATKRRRCPARRTRNIERLESRLALSAVPLNAQPLDTGEFMLGDVLVSVVFFESNGTVDANTENWNTAHANQVKQNIEEGLQWWEDTLALQTDVHDLDFQIDYTYADAPISIGIEPITRVATDFEIWVGAFLDSVGAERTGEIDNDVRLFNHSQRVAHGANWAFTIFVINAQNDTNGFFADGSVQGAFSIAGGAFMALPSRRPASTVAHEVAHQFWAMDEYAGSGASYESTRGYYDTQNSNFDSNENPNPIETSLLGNQDSLAAAYAAHTSSTASFESIGWKDSDGDGIFDVFDVPISFSASSFFDPDTNQLQVQGEASIGILPNLNSWGLQNSVTTNRLSHIEYRNDGGAWQTGPTLDDYSANFHFAIQLPNAIEHAVEVRVVDATGYIFSDVLNASTEHVDSTAVQGFTGYVTYDENKDGVYNPGEAGLAGWTVEVIDAQGNPVVTEVSIEPDDFSHNHIFYDPIGGVSLSAVGTEITTGFADASSRNSSLTSTGGRGFFNYSANSNSWNNVWYDRRQLRMDFASPVSHVSIDAIAEVDGDVGILEVYDFEGTLLARYTTSPLAAGTSETMFIELSEPNAAYAIARGHLNDTVTTNRDSRYVALDNLKVGRPHSVVTNEWGAFSLPFDLTSSYQLKLTGPNGKEVFFTPQTNASVSLTPQSSVQRIAWSLAVADDSWHNPLQLTDVNFDGVTDSADREILLAELVNPQITAGASTKSVDLTEFTHTEFDPRLDVNADGRFSKLDLLAFLDLQDVGNQVSPEPASVYAPTVYAPLTLLAGPTVSAASQPEKASGVNTETVDSPSLEGEPLVLLTPSVSSKVPAIDQEIESAFVQLDSFAAISFLPTQQAAIISSAATTLSNSVGAKELDEAMVDEALAELIEDDLL
ncbi:hypothetical protein ACYFX5_05645 [Bremerella sp. T1]|uniref:hypothetical protein n=1 Tax=Bremerella sp. TYQ1 TaxID=3119568 RepID=UPI001CCF09BE|nr:hypothetical protein [Bremerella volcania]UBM37742.1 hypothetical protein LA756_07585 [Bremerella volcania]